MEDVENIVGTAIYKLKIDTSDVSKELDNAKNIITNTMSSGASSSRTLAEGVAEITLSVNLLRQSFGALSQGLNVINNLTESFNQYEASLNGVKAVSKSMGESVIGSLNAVKEVTSGGLISQADAAASIKNLELYGFSVDEATQLMKVMADTAVYNRQSNYSVSEAVRVTTEGIRMENSVLSDASGITKNIAKMYEEYAKELGTTAEALSRTQKQQAVLNGFLEDGRAFYGNAAEYSNSLAGSQQRLNVQIETLKQNLGAAFSQFSPIIGGIATWISNNQQLATTIAATASILIGASGLVGAISVAVKAIKGITNAMTTMGLVSKAAKGGLIGLAVGAAAISGALLASSGVNAAIEASIPDIDDFRASSAMADEQLSSLKKTMDDTAREATKLSNQLSKLTRDYERDLKQIAVKHEENLADLNKQIEEANIDYRRAIDERNAEFNVSLAKQERSHQETVDELMSQINFLQRYNNDYNKQKLAQVEFALAKEQRLYQQETEAQQAEIDLQNQADKEKLDARLASLQVELNEELALMEKHREDLNSVRHVILLDEIESLKERYAEQRNSYNAQIAEAQSKGASAAKAYYDAYQEIMKERIKYIEDSNKKALSFLYTDEGKFDFVANEKWKVMTPEQQVEAIKNQSLSPKTNSSSRTTTANLMQDKNLSWRLTDNVRLFNTGGFTGRGNPTEVAGVVHKGEFVVPANQVDQSTGLIKSGAGGNTYNITVTGGVWASSAQAKREFAAIIKQAAEQTDQARLRGASI